MTNKIEIDALTGQTTTIELTAEEVAQIESDNLDFEASLQAEREAKESAKTSALAKLAALGLTEEEIAAL